MNAMRDAWTDERFDQLNARFDSLQQSIIVVGGGLFTAFLVAMTGLIATRL